VKFDRIKTILIFLGVFVLAPLTELIPGTLARAIIQLLICIALTVLLILEKENIGGAYDKLIDRIRGGKEQPVSRALEGMQAAGPPVEELNEISLWKKLGFNILAILTGIWLWGGFFASLMMLMKAKISRQAALFTSFSAMVAGAIVYLVLLSIVLWFLKSRRKKDDYPFLIRPREKTFIIYAVMFFLALVLALIYKMVFKTSLIATFKSILITAAVIILAGPLVILIKQFIFYRATRVRNLEETFEEGLAARIRAFCSAQKVRLPILYILEDDSPIQAFTFGYGPPLAWIYLARGMKGALSEQEFETVINHEIGHIKHWDFLAIAAPAIILSSIFEVFSSAGATVQKDVSHPVHMLVILFSIIIINFTVYALQKYLSRTREYYADEFSAGGTGNPDANSTALAKICYGLSGPRNHPDVSVEDMKKAMLWDLKNPWARIIEFLMTHPLTANRTRYMAVLARTIRGSSFFSTATDSLHRYFQFLLDVLVDWGFSLSFLLSVGLVIYITYPGTGILFCIVGFIVILTTLYKYPFLVFNFNDRTARSLMQDEKMSPIRGTPVAVEGRIIGRATPGAKLSADPVVEDETGFAICNYQLVNQKFIPGAGSNDWVRYFNPFFLYHLFLGYFKMEQWQKYDKAKVLGWFRRTGSFGSLEILKIVLNCYACVGKIIGRCPQLLYKLLQLFYINSVHCLRFWGFKDDGYICKQWIVYYSGECVHADLTLSQVFMAVNSTSQRFFGVICMNHF